MATIQFGSADEQHIEHLLSDFDEVASNHLSKMHKTLSGEEAAYVIDVARERAAKYLRVRVALNAVAQHAENLGGTNQEGLTNLKSGGDALWQLFDFDKDERIQAMIERDAPTEDESSKMAALLEQERREWDEAREQLSVEKRNKAFDESTRTLEERVKAKGLWHVYSDEGSLFMALDRIGGHVETLAKKEPLSV